MFCSEWTRTSNFFSNEDWKIFAENKKSYLMININHIITGKNLEVGKDDIQIK